MTTVHEIENRNKQHHKGCCCAHAHLHSHGQVITVCNEPAHIVIEAVEFEDVTGFRYLDSLITDDNSNEKEILSRICLAQDAFQKLNKCLFSRKDISIVAKICVYMLSVCTILLNGSESCGLTSSLASKISTCEMRFLRQMSGSS
jgi:hypothetical protein